MSKCEPRAKTFRLCVAVAQERSAMRLPAASTRVERPAAVRYVVRRTRTAVEVGVRNGRFTPVAKV